MKPSGLYSLKRRKTSQAIDRILNGRPSIQNLHASIVVPCGPPPLNELLLVSSVGGNTFECAISAGSFRLGLELVQSPNFSNPTRIQLKRLVSLKLGPTRRQPRSRRGSQSWPLNAKCIVTQELRRSSAVVRFTLISDLPPDFRTLFWSFYARRETSRRERH